MVYNIGCQLRYSKDLLKITVTVNTDKKEADFPQR